MKGEIKENKLKLTGVALEHGLKNVASATQDELVAFKDLTLTDQFDVTQFFSVVDQFR